MGKTVVVCFFFCWVNVYFVDELYGVLLGL